MTGKRSDVDQDQPGRGNRLRARRLGIDTLHEAVVFMRSDCPVCRSEGFDALARVKLTHGTRTVIATLYHVTSDAVASDEAGLSEAAWNALALNEGDLVSASHPHPLGSLSRVRGKVYGERLDSRACEEIIGDIVGHRYSDVHISAFVTACSSRGLDHTETVALTAAMVQAGERLTWPASPVVDKHSVGGLPGNRTTPIVVAIVTACGLTMPKTSSRAITSPAGTADTMETLAPVDLNLAAMRRVVEREGGCVVWGGAVHLSPADDTIIRIERALEIDSAGQLAASVLSKKIAAGSTHLVIDMPVGPTAKVRTSRDADELCERLLKLADSFGLLARVVRSDGRQPIGRGIGPALEAQDVLAVLQRTPGAPCDLREQAVILAGHLLEMGGVAKDQRGRALAAEILADGRAWQKFQRICDAQGGMRKPPVADHHHPVLANRRGKVSLIDNRRLAMVAKLAGAPEDKAAGVELHVRLGSVIDRGEPLFTLHAETPGELAYALDYLEANLGIIDLEEL